jgi:hypothetical protein
LFLKVGWEVVQEEPLARRKRRGRGNVDGVEGCSFETYDVMVDIEVSELLNENDVDVIYVGAFFFPNMKGSLTFEHD